MSQENKQPTNVTAEIAKLVQNAKNGTLDDDQKDTLPDIRQMNEIASLDPKPDN